ncbi:hypothetical protein C3V36_13720 [Lachnospiraceae bacterium oral taxon 500]|nr:hypothetical protein C3V36_13720 [Lachnospiraceae bacterium oral taxon 500]
MSVSLGTIIRELRKKKGLSQKELAEGICSLKQLSRIENNTSEASTYLIYELSFRLGENLLDYFPYAELEEPFLWKKRVDELEQYYSEERYQEMYRQSKILKDDELVRSFVFLRQRINWYFGIAAGYCQPAEAFSAEDFLNLIALTHPFTKVSDIWQANLKPFELRILNAAIFVHLQAERYDIAEEWLLKAITILDRCYFEVKDNAYLNFFYNLSRLYFYRQEYKKALQVADQGLRLCQENNILYQVAGLSNIKGRSLYCLGRKEEALLYMNLFLQLNDFLGENSHFKDKNVNQNLRNTYQLAPLGYITPSAE